MDENPANILDSDIMDSRSQRQPAICRRLQPAEGQEKEVKAGQDYDSAVCFYQLSSSEILGLLPNF